GFSFGGNIGRFLASQSNRLEKVIFLGISFGSSVYGGFDKFIHTYLEKWKPINREIQTGNLDMDALDENDRKLINQIDMPAWCATLEAMLTWGTITPSDLLCPGVLIVGSKNENALTELEKYYDSMKKNDVEFELVEGLTHMEEFTRKDIILPILLSQI
ncbi:MAG: hypothetical protein ACXAD7_14470, partial [Candidatus Kariarchaeaceae archaeon]